VLYSETFGLFFFPDKVTAQFWTSPDGLAWTLHPVAHPTAFASQTVVDGAGFTVAIRFRTRSR